MPFGETVAPGLIPGVHPSFSAMSGIDPDAAVSSAALSTQEVGRINAPVLFAEIPLLTDLFTAHTGCAFRYQPENPTLA